MITIPANSPLAESKAYTSLPREEVKARSGDEEAEKMNSGIVR
jgi:hypothetical protein